MVDEEKRMLEKILDLILTITKKDVSGDANILNYLINAETQRALNIINCETLPTELEHVIVRRVVGVYLQTNIVALVGAENLEVPTQIKMGDTQVSFSGKSAEDRLKEVGQLFVNYGEGELTCFRRLKW